MRRFLAWCSGIGWLRRAAVSLGVHRLVNRFLSARPVVKTLPGSGVRFRAVRLESIPLGVEMLEEGKTYDREYLQSLGPIESFADLGCNVGYFSVLLAHLGRGRALRGLMVDANPEVVGEAEWHAQNNAELRDAKAVWGLVGETGSGETGDFYVYSSNICSSRQPVPAGGASLPGTWSAVKAPRLVIGDLWRSQFGELRCQLLKVDVEGAELDFFRLETSFLQRVNIIILEWHKWSVKLSDIESLLRANGFALDKIFEENAELGTCAFRRK